MKNEDDIFIRYGAYSNINGWSSKMILINKVNKKNQILIIFYSEEEEPLMFHEITLDPFEIRSIELNFEALKNHFGRIRLEGEGMFDGSVATIKEDSCIDLRLVKLDGACC